MLMYTLITAISNIYSISSKPTIEINIDLSRLS